MDIILNERLYCSDYDKLNDPFEGLFWAIIRSGAFSPAFSSNDFDSQVLECKKIIDPLKICSLSSSLNDVRMWSFYGDDHRGIAIEIDFTAFQNDRKEVDYSDKLSEYDLTKPGSLGPDPFEVLTKKTTHWCYESEYRIIQKKEYYPIKGRIMAIYLGERISDIKRISDIRLQKLVKKLEKNIPHLIPVYTTKLDTYEIKIEPDKQLGRDVKGAFIWP